MTAEQHMFRTISSADDIQSPDLKQLYSEWAASFSVGIAPKALDLLVFGPLLRRCNIFNITGDNPKRDSEIIFSGSELVSLVDFELTGRTVGDFDDFPNGQKLIWTSMERAAPICFGPVQTVYEDLNFIKTEYLALPLSKDGKSVSQVIFAMGDYSRTRSKTDL